MTRIATMMVAGALALAATSTASAQVNLSFGNPAFGQGTTLSFGQPAYTTGYGYGVPGVAGYNYGYAGQPYVGQAYPYAGYPAYAPAVPYGTGTTYYSSGYRGYVAPGTTIIQQRSTGLPFNAYNSGYRLTNPYGTGFGVPYGRGLDFNRGIGRTIRIR